MLRRLSSVALLASAATLAAFGCGAFFDPSALGGGESEPIDGGEAGTEADAATRAPDAPDAPDAPVEAASGCPSGEGPSMVRIDDFCVDSTEVTRAQYARFVNAVGADAGGPDLPQCVSNVNLAPIDPSLEFPPPPPETPEFPVRGVDWCDAKAYCLWAGKDLCGGLAGAKLAIADVTDPKMSQWAKACSKDGAQRFAYSDSYTSGRCVEGDKPTSPANTSCEGGYRGLFDMVGNVAEWIDACKPPLDPYAPCALMGRVEGANEIASCTTTATPQATVPWVGAGVRCCAPAKK